MQIRVFGGDGGFRGNGHAKGNLGKNLGFGGENGADTKFR